MTDKYRRDGTPYPDNNAGLMEWARDFDTPRHVGLNRTADGWHKVSTVWLGLDHNFWPGGKPLIFETAVFNELKMTRNEIMGRDFAECDIVARYSTEAEALKGHQDTLDGYDTRHQVIVCTVICVAYLLVCLLA